MKAIKNKRIEDLFSLRLFFNELSVLLIVNLVVLLFLNTPSTPSPIWFLSHLKESRFNTLLLFGFAIAFFYALYSLLNKKIRVSAISFCVLVTTTTLILTTQSAIIQKLFSGADHETTLSNSLSLLGFELQFSDHSIAKTVVDNLSHINLIEFLSIEAYKHIGAFIIFSFCLTFWRNQLLFRRLVFSFFALVTISLPLWLYYAAISPYQIGYRNIFTIDAKVIEKVTLNNPSTYWTNESEKIDSKWYYPDTNSLATSTIPSMHTAWGLLVAIAVSKTTKNRAIRFVYVCWAILNTLGTLFTLQHYILDLLLGAFLTTIVWVVSKKIVTHFKYSYVEEARKIMVNPFLKETQ